MDQDTKDLLHQIINKQNEQDKAFASIKTELSDIKNQNLVLHEETRSVIKAQGEKFDPVPEIKQDVATLKEVQNDHSLRILALEKNK